MVIRYTHGDLCLSRKYEFSFFVCVCVYDIRGNSEEVHKWTCLCVSAGKNMATFVIITVPNAHIPFKL